MKALTLTQPWASLVAYGFKKIETRSWNTNHRGPLAIHAAKGFPRPTQQLCRGEPFLRYLKHIPGYDGPQSLPRGVVIATCTLLVVLPMPTCMFVPEPEASFGVYETGRFAWYLDDIDRLPEPIPARGRLGLWTWEQPDAA